MLEDRVNERLDEIDYYDKYLLFEVCGMYINLLLEPHNTSSLRKNLIKFYRSCIKHSRLEKDVLNIIKKSVPSDKNLKICEEIMDDVDTIHFKEFNYSEWVISLYNEMLTTKNYSNVNIEKKEFPTLDEDSIKVLIKELRKDV